MTVGIQETDMVLRINTNDIVPDQLVEHCYKRPCEIYGNTHVLVRIEEAKRVFAPYV